MVDDVYFCLPYFEPHALFRDYMLCHPDADIVWSTAPDGTSDASMDDRTVRGFRRWHQALQEAACTPLRRMVEGDVPFAQVGWPPV